MYLPRNAGLRLTALTTLGLAALSPTAQAQSGVAFTLDQKAVTLTQGQSFTFTGSIRNDTGRALFSTYASGFSNSTASYTVRDYVFPNLVPDGFYSGPLFTVDTSKVGGFNGQTGPTPVGAYTSFLTQYIFSYSVVTNAQQFTLRVNAAPVPEASTTVSLSLLLALGIGRLVVAKRKKAQSAL